MTSIKSSLGVEEIKNYKPLLQQLFAELLGTFLYLTIVPLTAHEMQFSVLTVGLANGLLVSSVVQIIGNVSGGHINPAVTMGALVCGQIKLLRALFYIAAQTVGGIAGASASYSLLSTDLQENFGGIIQYGHIAIFGLEVLLTFVFVAVALSVTDPTRVARGLGSAALAIGFGITTCECSCTFYTVGINPVRILPIAVVASLAEKSHKTSRDWSRIWIYCAAPFIGGILAGLVYRFVLNLKIGKRAAIELSSA